MFFVLSLYSCLRRRPHCIIFQMYDFLEEEDPGVDIPAVRRGANFNCRDKTWKTGKVLQSEEEVKICSGVPNI